MQEDQNFDFDGDDQQPAEKNPLRQHLRELEKEVAELRREKAEAAEAKRELAFAKAGIPMETPMAKYFVKGYDGELTPDAIRQAAEEAGLVGKVQVDPLRAEAEAWKRSNQASNGTNLEDEPVDWKARLANATSEKEVMEILDRAREAIS